MTPTRCGEARPELVVPCGCHLGESALWHPQQQRLYWVDIPQGHLHRWDPGSGKHERFPCGEEIGALVLRDDGSLLLFQSEGQVRSWRDGSLAPLLPRHPSHRGHRFNDATADPAGNVLCGVMALPEHGDRRASGLFGKVRRWLGARPRDARGLYHLGSDGSLARILRGVRLSNGLGFTPDRQHLYHTDSRARTIRRYAYDPSTGRCHDPQDFTRLDQADGLPDGLTVDADGGVWSALWDGAAVIRYDPQGREAWRISLPVRDVTSVAFGGDDLGDLYVTTAGGTGDARSPAGGLYRLRPGVRGLPELPARLASREPG